MRRNDFFKYLLLGGGGSASRSELESETLPYTFVSKSQRLRNYRIYGNDGGVGDYDGETGTYTVPVTVNGENTVRIELDEPLRKIGNYTDYLDFRSQKIYRYTVKKVFDGTETFQYGSIKQFRYSVPANDSIDITGIYMISNIYDVTDGSTLFKNRNTDNYQGIALLSDSIRIVDNVNFPDGNISSFKQYLADLYAAGNPLTVQYVSLVYDVSVGLPALPTLSGTNTLSVGTTVQPSKVYLQGKISEAEIVSAEPVQTNVQSLQPISLNDDLQLDVMPTESDLQLDVMPIDRSEFQINDISEVPVEDENSVEEIPETENFETSGDEENAE